jgi:hypothetical protein
MNYYNYFTEIEEHFVKRRGKHLLISPMDWALISAWRDAGVPLQVALRGIDIAMDGFLARRDRDNSKVNSLCYCHDAVMTEFAGHLESHVGESTADSPEINKEAENVPESGNEIAAEEILKFLSGRISEIRALSAKQSLEGVLEGIQRVLSRMEEVYRNLQSGGRIDSEALERDLRIIDELLTTELRAAVAVERTLEWETEAKKELKIYKKRLQKETYDKIKENFMRDRIHREFNIGELSIFHL